jgi:type II secretory pathway pseudopilin PulG
MLVPRVILSRLRRDERGYTLIEQLVVCGLLAIILAAILGLSEVATKLAPQDRERVHAIHEAQTSLDRMNRELREAHAITIQPFKATASVVKAGATVTVTYDCSAAPVNGLRECTRQEGTGAKTTEIARLANADARPVFTATQRADSGGVSWTTYVRTLIEVPARGERSAGAKSRIVLDDGFYLRNVDALH